VTENNRLDRLIAILIESRSWHVNASIKFEQPQGCCAIGHHFGGPAIGVECPAGFDGVGGGKDDPVG